MWMQRSTSLWGHSHPCTMLFKRTILQYAFVVHWPSLHSIAQLVEMLINCGADINIKESYHGCFHFVCFFCLIVALGWTPLFVAVRAPGRDNIVALLLAKGMPCTIYIFPATLIFTSPFRSWCECSRWSGPKCVLLGEVEFSFYLFIAPCLCPLIVQRMGQQAVPNHPRHASSWSASIRRSMYRGEPGTCSAPPSYTGAPVLPKTKQDTPSNGRKPCLPNS